MNDIIIHTYGFFGRETSENCDGSLRKKYVSTCTFLLPSYPGKIKTDHPMSSHSHLVDLLSRKKYSLTFLLSPACRESGEH